MLDAKNDDLAQVLIDPVEDSVGATSGRVDSGQLTPQWFAHPLGVLDKSARHELDHGTSDGFWES